ncbi:cation-translocating P-type ATPase [Lamprobacter modestohalophilus]|nr:cation-transporting P-type ATPase [Lamprobacter modestohalophilus]
MTAFYRQQPEGALEQVDSDADHGLSEAEVRKRREQYGRNALRQTRSRPAWRILIDQLASIVVLLLLAASGAALLFGQVIEAIAIGAAILVNTIIGFVMELRATRAMEALQRMGKTQTRVLREGHSREISADELVPGDIVLLDAGDLVPADLRLLEANRLQCDEAALTGESVPVDKRTEAIDSASEAGPEEKDNVKSGTGEGNEEEDIREDAIEDRKLGSSEETTGKAPPLGERYNMAYKGTAVTQGSGSGVVVATGMDTELGHISDLVAQAEQSATPLEKRLDRLGRRLVWLTLAIAVVVAGAGLIAGKELFVMLETAIALAIAAVPEGLPVVATLALAQGMRQMARRNAVVKRLSAVETLGAASLIFTDKTGTLTENRMVLAQLALEQGTLRFERPGQTTTQATEGRGQDEHRRQDEGGRRDESQREEGRGGGDARADGEARAGTRITIDGKALDLANEPAARAALETGALCNNAELGSQAIADNSDARAAADGSADTPAGETATAEAGGDAKTNANAKADAGANVHASAGENTKADAGGSAKADAIFGATGDPTEVSLLEAAALAGLHRPELLERWPEQREISFDPDLKMMATVHQSDDGFRIAVKGAPESVLDVCDQVLTADGETALDDAAREHWRQRSEALAADGLRVLALAQRQAEREDEDPYQRLTLIGLAGLYDPPRRGIQDVIAACQQAGIRIVMGTGDHAATAQAIAAEIGIAGSDEPAIEGARLDDLEQLDDDERRELLERSVFARISPEEKLQLIGLYQDAGWIVGMTGDGVNDAPALKKADIGIAMGQRGTEVAREASDMVLKDDAFATLVAAIEHGRTIFTNIRRFIVYLLSGNLAEIMAVAAAALVAAPLPLLPLQILYINFVSDVMPALALGLSPGERGVMQQPPRAPDEPILMRRHWAAVGGYGALIAATVLIAFAIALGPMQLDTAHAVTISFLTFGFARLWHVLNMRDTKSPLLLNEVTRNPYVWIAIAIGVALLIVATYIAPLAAILSIEIPTLGEWLLILGFSLLPLILVQLGKLVAHHLIRSQRSSRSHHPSPANR